MALPENVPEVMRGKRVPWAMCLGYTPGETGGHPGYLVPGALDQMTAAPAAFASGFVAGAVAVWSLLADADQQPLGGCVCPICVFLRAGYDIFGGPT